jgi:AcrR family transcriptional regulator
MSDPLVDTLFRSTVRHAPPPPIASAAPVREVGTRTRAGNAMNRTRAALLDGARRAVEVSGTKITMAQVAAAAGVAKATLYNHFRTREAVLDALLRDEVAAMAERAQGRALPEALAAVAQAISDHPLLATLARGEPATVAALGRIDRRAEGWRIAATAVDELLAADGRTGGGLVLRWLASFVVSPAGPNAVAEDVAALVAALPGKPESVATA